MPKVIGTGCLLGAVVASFIGLEKGDNETKCKRMFDKIVKYRMFYDENEKLNLNVEQVSGSILLVSQFTLAANTASGNRPSFDPAMAPSEAKVLYEKFISYAHSKFPRVEEGIFAADMKVI